ncbi:hypothetical protein [Priestia filamentosa]|uniref:hypothetical protein n=1 Tax=Priestia filamentosa TaxID=1402861 RepID=UPI002E1BF1F3|nr:hypothetical protein [Priestia filamentosa]
MQYYPPHYYRNQPDERFFFGAPFLGGLAGGLLGGLTIGAIGGAYRPPFYGPRPFYGPPVPYYGGYPYYR